MAWTALKGVQVQPQSAHPIRPNASELLTANVGSVRMIVETTGTGAYLTDNNTYVQSIRDVGIIVILCLNIYPSTAQATFNTRINTVVGAIDADVYEIGNEPDDPFRYPGNGVRADWGGFFDACEDATGWIRAIRPTRTIILGSSVDVKMNQMLGFAEARVPKTSTFVDGYALHPYGQGPSVNSSVTKVSGARSHVPISKSLWITEMGWGVGGNTNSTLVCDEPSVTTNIRSAGPIGPLPLSVIPVTSMPAGFTAPGANKLFVFNNDAPTAHGQVITYTGTTPGPNFSFTGCNGGTGSIDAGKLVSSEITPVAGDSHETVQRDLLNGVFDQLWAKVFTWRLAVVGWFMWHDVASPTQWWHYCGLFRNANTPRASYTAFQNQPRIVQTGNASLSGQTTFRIVPQGLALGRVAFSGLGTQTGRAHKIAVGKTIISGNGTLTANGGHRVLAASSLASDSTLTATPRKTLRATSTLAGAGLQLALGLKRGKGGANLVGNADQTALARKLALGSSTSTIRAQGILAAIGTKHATTPNTSILSGSGSLTVISVRVRAPADASFTGIADLIGKHQIRRPSSAALSGKGAMVAIPRRRVFARPILSGATTFSAAAVKVLTNDPIFSATSTATWQAHSIQVIRAELSAEAAMSVVLRGISLDHYHGVHLTPQLIIYIGTPRTLELSKPKVRIQADRTTLTIDSKDSALPITMATS